MSLEQTGAIGVVDLDSGGVEILATGGLPHGLALQHDAEGDRLLVTDREHDSVRRFVIGGPAATWREVAPTHMTGWPHAVVTRDDGTFAVARASDAVLQIDGREVGVSSLPETVALSSDQTRVAQQARRAARCTSSAGTAPVGWTQWSVGDRCARSSRRSADSWRQRSRRPRASPLSTARVACAR